MRIRSLIITALIALPVVLPGQVLRPPRRATTPEPAPLPPTGGPIARDLALKRSKWTVEGYSLISMLQTSNGNGGLSRVTTLGNGTHSDYRFADHLSASLDMTASYLGATSQTAEMGVRYSPFDWSASVRPFFDARGGYMRVYDAWTNPGGISMVGSPDQNGATGSQYSRGFGGIIGTGVDYSVSNSLAVTGELMAVRNRMMTSKVSSNANLPSSNRYMLTSYRFAFGLKYNPARTSSLAQPTR